jgi:MtrB/PioB family decaheme-associated outer membrane protein
MKSTKWQGSQRSALAAALLAAWGTPQAEDATVAELTKPESSVSVGIGNWSNNREQQGIFDGMRKGGGYGLLDADISRRDDETGTWFNFRGRNLGLDTRELRAEFLRQGEAGVSFEYNAMPRNSPLIINSPLRGIGGTTLIGPGVGVNALPFNQVELGTKRELATLGLYKNLGTGLDFKFSFKNEEKNGTRLWGRGGQPEFAVEPIDSTTRQVESVIEYSGKRFQMTGGYYGSWYNNANNLVDTIRQGANPATLTNHIYLSLPLDNQAHQVFTNGGFNFTDKTRGTFKLAYTKATQNETLPTSLIPGLAFAGAPKSLDGRLDTTLAQLGLTSRPTTNFSFTANLRYYANEEKTPQARIVQTNAACPAAGNCVDNTPLSFKTTTGKLEGTYRLPMGFSLIGGVDQVNQDRNIPVGSVVGGLDNQRFVPFRSRLDETTVRLQLRRSMSETVNGSLAFLHSNRYGSGLTRTNLAQQDQINPIHIADRTRDKVRASVDWSPFDRLAMTFNVEDSRDRYDASRPFGMRSGDGQLFSLDVSLALNDAWKLTGFYSYDKTQALQYNQRTSTGGGAIDALMEDRLSDNGQSLGFGIRGEPAAKFKLGADLQWTRNVSAYNQAITRLNATPAYPAGAGGPLPDIHNDLARIKLFGTYDVQKSATIRLDFIHELWKTDDWSWMFANGTPFTYSTAAAASPASVDGTTVTQNYRQSSTFVSAKFIYKF